MLHRASGFAGALVALDGKEVVLRGQTGLERRFPNQPGGFAVDGTAVRLVAPTVSDGAPPPTHLARARVSTTDRTASGSRAVVGAQARVARAARILVEGVHDAELVEHVWGDDLRIEGVVVERLDGADHLAAALAELRPGPKCRVGVLLDHLVPGSKEARLAHEVAHPSVLVTGTPYVDVWQAVRPSAVGIPAWPEIPKGTDWKTGVCAALGVDDPAFWRRILASVTSWKDLEQPLVKRGRAADRLRHCRALSGGSHDARSRTLDAQHLPTHRPASGGQHSGQPALSTAVRSPTSPPTATAGPRATQHLRRDELPARCRVPHARAPNREVPQSRHRGGPPPPRSATFPARRLSTALPSRSARLAASACHPLPGTPRPLPLPIGAILVVGLGLVVGPLVLGWFGKTDAADQVPSGRGASRLPYRRTVDDTFSFNAAFIEMRKAMFPAVAQKLGMSDAQFDTYLHTNYPALMKFLDKWDASIYVGARALSLSQIQYMDEFHNADATPYKALPWLFPRPPLPLRLRGRRRAREP